MNRSSRVIRAASLAAAALAAAACSSAPTTPPWHQEAGYRWRDLTIAQGTPGFTEMQGWRSGVRFENTVSEAALVDNRVLAQGAGVALGDVDGDGLVDVFLGRTEGCSALFHNRGGWKFDDVSREGGVVVCDRYTTGAAFADIDGDRDLDLILLSTTGPNVIFVNDGKGHFTERRDLGLDAAGKGGTTITLADVDGDGRLDMYVANYKAFSVDDSIPPQQRSFSQLVRQTVAGTYEAVPARRRDYKVVNRPDMGGIRLTVRASPDDFYANAGGRFVHIPLTSARFSDALGRPLTEEPESFGLGAKLVDLTGDGAPDLFVANDFEDMDELWLNDGKGNFRLADWTAVREMSNSSMGADVADVDGDGLPDLFTVDMLSNDSRRLRTQIPTHTSLPKLVGDIQTQLQQQRNSLFLNRGDGTFAEIANAAGVEASGWSWSTMFLDVDLDGREDILVANGHLWDIMDADVQEGLQNRLNDTDWRRLRWQFPKLPLKNVAFRNRGDMTFEDASAKWRFGREADISHTMAAGDLDGDGDLDVVVNRLGSPALLLRNDAAAPRVAVRLVGDAPNTQAVGARIRLTGGAVPVQAHEVVAGGLYMSHSDYETSFAMGASDSATIEIRWRDGRTSTIAGVRPNRLYEITTATARAERPNRIADKAPLFEDVSAQLGGHRHVDIPFDDWETQFLLPNALSQLGPGVAWFDLDRDGAEDLVVGTGKGGKLATFHNARGRLVPDRAQKAIVPADLTSVLGVAESGRVRILAGVSTWEAASDAERMAQPAAVEVDVTRGRVSPTARQLVGSHEPATGPLALGDYDGDGELDLFIGSRVMPRQYPASGPSGLFRGRGGRFVLDTANMSAVRDAGMVSAAMFADANGDGHPDLVLAREWGSLLLLLNDGRGHFARAASSWGLDGWTSRWNGVAAGDINGDGRLDLVATSWGRNTPTPVDSAHPLDVLYGAFGAGGRTEPILAQRDPRVGGLAPLASFARMRVAIPNLVRRVSTFAAFADASVDKLLGDAKPARLSIRTLDHMAFINRGDHFEPVALPEEAQFAPAFYAGVADFDGDGAEDVFLSQNFFPTAVGAPRYDEGRSLLLAGDGKGGLVPMPGAKSGLLVYGDQRGAAYADFDGDGRLDLAVSQNGAATKLFRNRGARPGLRVRLVGPAANPDAIGAQVRIVSGPVMGPVREIQAGSGYWSQNGAVQVLTSRTPPTEVWVRWPGGAESRTRVTPGAREITVRQPAGR